MRAPDAWVEPDGIRSWGTNMTPRTHILALATLLVVGCSTATSPGGGGSTPGPGGDGSTPAAGGGAAASSAGGGGGSGVADAAAAVTDVCSAMPVDLVRSYVPKAGEPAYDAAYHQCTMSDGTSAIQITVLAGFGPPDPPDPAQTVSDLGQHAWLQEQTTDDAYLVIDLGATAKGSYETLYVEYAGHDKKGHAQDAIAIAKAVIEAL
jgi:hypothetical protein